jgi:hemerythrin
MEPIPHLGVPAIDAQHQLLVQLLERLSRVLVEFGPKDRLVRLLREIKKYAEYHFTSEENYMVDLAYPLRAEHARHHSEMLAELSVRIGRANASWRQAAQVEEFLQTWLTHHIGIEDRKLADFVAGVRRGGVNDQAAG